VNQELIESKIRDIQPAEQIELGIQTTNGRDSVLIVKITVDNKIPDEKLNSDKANLVLESFFPVLQNQDWKSLSTCKIFFIKKDGGLVSTTKSIGFVCPINAEFASRLSNFKDSSKTTIGYIDPSWNYINKDLNLSLPLKAGWHYASEEHDSILYYTVGTDVNELPQYRTDSDRKVTFATLRDLRPGDAYQVFLLHKNIDPFSQGGKSRNNFMGPSIFAGLTMNLFNSEDEYIKNLYELLFSKKLEEDQIRTYRFGNLSFRGYLFSNVGQDGKMIYSLSLVKRFRKVSLVMNLKYSDKEELQEINQALSGMKING
jgi:hypothetical protein